MNFTLYCVGCRYSPASAVRRPPYTRAGAVPAYCELVLDDDDQGCIEKKLCFRSFPPMNEAKSRAPLVSAAELDALLRGANSLQAATPDLYMPLRVWILLGAVSVVAVRLLFFTDDVAAVFARNQEAAQALAPYLYFRGWWLVVVSLIGAWSYARSWYPGLVFGGLLLSSSVSFLFDAFSVYAFILMHPSPSSTGMLLVRVFLMIIGYQCFRRAGRIPARSDRWNPLLFLRKPPGAEPS